MMWTFTYNYCWLNRILLFSYSFPRISCFVVLSLWWGKYLLLFIHHHLFFERAFIFKVYQLLCTILYHLYNLKSVKNTYGGMPLLVKLQAYFTKSNIPPWVFFMFLEFHKWWKVTHHLENYLQNRATHHFEN